jgi:hypothetical protein
VEGEELSVLKASRSVKLRREEIEAAIAAYNDTDPDMLLPPAAAQLLTAMFAKADTCQRTIVSLEQEGLGRESLIRLLRHLVEIGFVSKERSSGRGRPNVYRLHLPPVRR